MKALDNVHVFGITNCYWIFSTAFLHSHNNKNDQETDKKSYIKIMASVDNSVSLFFFYLWLFEPEFLIIFTNLPHFRIARKKGTSVIWNGRLYTLKKICFFLTHPKRFGRCKKASKWVEMSKETNIQIYKTILGVSLRTDFFSVL